jgi:hypothetical protein
MTDCLPSLRLKQALPVSWTPAPPVARHSLESLWVRLKVGGRVRPRDAQLLRRLSVPPFDESTVYELDSHGYVIALGLPGHTQTINAIKLLADFEARFGTPESFTNVVPFTTR